ncbi:MAG: InlB B-repeat-containing protein [Desulfobacterales bacterium]|nr:InlB B-repeat-containing protein [Desulfobacterales bacterium]
MAEARISPIVTPYMDYVNVFAFPSKMGYTFGGWFTDAALTTQYVNGPQPASDFTLYAKWNGTQFSLIYRDF